MASINKWGVVLLFGSLAGLHSASCSSDGVYTSDTQSEEEDRLEERRLCQGTADWEQRCLLENGYELQETLEQRFDRCMEGFFSEAMKPCREVSIAYADCIPTQHCDVFPYTNDSAPRGCLDESYDYSVCSAGPQQWEDLGCDASKCPGECCQGGPKP